MNESEPIENQPIKPCIQVIGLGELLWDCFPDRKLPGGAPGNVAFHSQQLGLSAAVATRVGQDALGEELTQFLAASGLNTDFVQVDPSHATGTVTISSDSTTNVGYSFLENSAWDYLEPKPELLEAIGSAGGLLWHIVSATTRLEKYDSAMFAGGIEGMSNCFRYQPAVTVLCQGLDCTVIENGHGCEIK